MKLLKLILTFGFITLINACSGGGSSAPVKAADITTDNAQKLSIAATDSTRQAVNTNTADFLNLSASQFKIQTFSEKLTQQVQRSSDLGIVCSPGSFTSNIGVNSLNGSITFNGCGISGIDGTIILSGTVNLSATNTNLSLSYNNFSITYNGLTEVVNFTMNCKSTTSSFNCSASSSFTGIDNRTYSVSNISVSSNFDASFNVSADVIDPDFGEISISASSVAYNCNAPLDDRPSNGTITITSNNKSASVIFSSCNAYTVTVDGVANIYNWVDPASLN